MVKKIVASSVVAVVALTGCSTAGGHHSLEPGTHKLNSSFAGTYKAPGSKLCKWTYRYKIRHNAPVESMSGGGYGPSVTISELGVRFTSDNCGTFKS